MFTNGPKKEEPKATKTLSSDLKKSVVEKESFIDKWAKANAEALRIAPLK
ncbi:hypothetical protein Dip510_000178 [Elusimicrobium posterum]